jgi:hypothetical protein
MLSRINPNPCSGTYFFKINSNIILPFLCLGLPKGLFPVGLSANILEALLIFFHFSYLPAHLILLDLIVVDICER